MIEQSIIRFLETAFLRSVRLKNLYPPLFIVGAPRSGTTVVTQHIINTFDVGYFSNLSKAHPKACVSYAWWARHCHRFSPSYENRYGIIDGAHAPSDGWDIFHRWFPRYDHAKPVRVDRLYELRNIVRMLEIIYDAPFANKNNANSTRIPYLDAVFPTALFVDVTRDIYDTVFSIMQGRRRNSIAHDQWWGAAPPQFQNHRFGSELERVVHQVWGVSRCIDGALQRIPSARWITVPYETFCEDPGRLLGWIGHRYASAGVSLRRRSGSAPVRFERRRHEFEERSTLEQEIDEIVKNLEALQ